MIYWTLPVKYVLGECSADDKSTLVQVMAWCRQATSHYLNQCWPIIREVFCHSSLGNKPITWASVDPYQCRHMACLSHNELMMFIFCLFTGESVNQAGYQKADAETGKYQVFEETASAVGKHFPDSNVHGANMGPIWGRQDPGGPMLAPWNLLSGLMIITMTMIIIMIIQQH